MKKIYKLPLVLEAQEEGGWTVTSPLVPELITEIDTIDEMDSRLQDAISAVVELYEEMGRSFPAEIHAASPSDSIHFESLVLAEA